MLKRIKAGFCGFAFRTSLIGCPEPPNCESPRMLHDSRGQTMRRNQTLCFDEVHHFLDGLFDGDLHAKRVLSLTNATLGVIKTRPWRSTRSARVSPWRGVW